MSMIQLKHLERFYSLAKGKFFYVPRDINLDAAQLVTIKGKKTVRNGFAQLQVEEIRKF